MENFFGNFKENEAPNTMEVEQTDSDSYLSIYSQDTLTSACVLKQGKTDFILCSRIQPLNSPDPNGLCLYPLKSVLVPKLSTKFLPFKDTYTKTFVTKTSNGYFASYQIKDQSTFLTLFRMTGKGFKKLTMMKFESNGICTDENALCFLEAPYQCLFVPGDGTVKFVDLKRKAVLDETVRGPFEGLKYHSKLRILAVKSREELYIMKLSPENKILDLGYKISGHESFKDGASRPDVNFMITQYADLKDYALDEDENILYTVYAWVSWTQKSVIFSLPPTITHLRFQKWKVSANGIELEDQKDVEWHHSRMQTFHLYIKQKQCFVNGINDLYIISLDTFNITKTINGKELFAITKDGTVVMQDARNKF